MGPSRVLRRPSARHRVGIKFTVAVGAVVLGVVAVAGIGAVGLAGLRSDIDRLIDRNLTTSRAASTLTTDLYEAEVLALWVAARPSTELEVALDQVQLPRVEKQLRTVTELTAGDPEASRQVAAVRSDFAGYQRLHAGLERESTAQVATLFGRMTAAAQQLREIEALRARESAAEAVATHRSTSRRLLVGTVLSLLVALAVVQLLVRGMVPRIRHYSRFARQVAENRDVEPLHVRGADELGDLGRALNHMVANTDLARRREVEQAEYADTLQVTATEDEAHELVQRHLERSLPGCGAVVLKRNNSENRLEPTTALEPDSPLPARLAGAEPRACLSLRFGRTHRQDPGRTPLLCCTICTGDRARTTCEPLLVGGQVIGSVLVSHPDPLAPDQEARIRNSVAQAAPVLANLRNLALAEFRANNDSLTGLPNKRATDDTLKRMVAQANRSITPLAAAMLDLDHFKQVNDRYGHAKGDEVLAAVGAALRSCLRASDFAGRFGGEELLVLLPDTSAEGAVVLAERIRSTIAAITVPEVDRQITVSIGIADLIQHGGDASGLLRQADRALYTAKATGRNRVVLADDHDAARHPGPGRTARSRPTPAPAGPDQPEPGATGSGRPGPDGPESGATGAVPAGTGRTGRNGTGPGGPGTGGAGTGATRAGSGTGRGGAAADGANGDRAMGNGANGNGANGNGANGNGVAGAGLPAGAGDGR